MKNKYCESSDLGNEASVERCFVEGLLKDLGFTNAQILPKESLEKLVVGSLGARKKEKYRPDYAIKLKKKIRVIIEAKSTSESLDDHFIQARDYCATLNGQSPTSKPVKYFLLTNGNLTRVYKHDLNKHLLQLKFSEFKDGNKNYKKLKDLLSKDDLVIEDTVTAATPSDFLMQKASIVEVNAAFAWCHQHIYSNDNISQGSAFSEFVKLIALKLMADKEIRDKYANQLNSNEFYIPSDEVWFSEHWLKEYSKSTSNPMDSIRFHDFIKDMNYEIQQKKRKRIFDEDDHIELRPDTILGVVRKLEHLFLFGIDADLNGRLFETFLNATMRGKDLGQYFTPRSVVKLGVGMSMLKVSVHDIKTSTAHIDKVIDACCGTGGFLIDALADMWHKVNSNKALSEEKKEKLRKQIANDHIYGMDVGRDPNLSRIARLNMYLHGDGGSRIFNVDSLDKTLTEDKGDKNEIKAEKIELRKIYSEKDGFFDVALTNPPFAKMYSTKGEKKDDDVTDVKRILSEYDIRMIPDGKEKESLRSSMMFFERYHDLIVPGGRLISVIDDGLLSGRENAWFRSYLRSRFVIQAVISLPGDAFQRSKARVKTSLIVLQKKSAEDETQPDVFMYACRFVGIDDHARQRSLPGDEKLRQEAKQEIQAVVNLYASHLDGKGKSTHNVSASRLTDRLDVKHCLMKTGIRSNIWKKKGLKVVELKDLVDLKQIPDDDVIKCKEYDGTVKYLRVRYDGIAEEGDEVDPSETAYSELSLVRTGDIVISNIAATYGSVAVVPDSLDGCAVSNEYTVLSAKIGYAPETVWALLRSKEARADMLILATGANRTRIKWDSISRIKLPYPSDRLATAFAQNLRKIKQEEYRIQVQRSRILSKLADDLSLDSLDAEKTLQAFKPPK